MRYRIDEQQTFEHESFAMCSVSRIHGHPVPLFGANVKHGDRIRLKINHAQMHRSLSRDWYHSGKEIVEIEMSQAQFAELITNTNTSGVPVTLRRLNLKGVEDPPFDNQFEIYDTEFHNELSAMKESLNEQVADAVAILDAKKAPNKSEKEQIKQALTMVQRGFGDALPFIKKSFTESMDKTMHEAKTAIDAYHMNRIVQLGTEAYKQELRLENQGYLIDTDVQEDVQEVLDYLAEE